MTVAPPLTAIHTPKKEDASKFPFPISKSSTSPTPPHTRVNEHAVIAAFFA
jgi:hypothetical protein